VTSTPNCSCRAHTLYSLATRSGLRVLVIHTLTTVVAIRTTAPGATCQPSSSSSRAVYQTPAPRFRFNSSSSAVVDDCRSSRRCELNNPPLPPVGHIWDMMLVCRKGNINNNCLCVTVLRTICTKIRAVLTGLLTVSGFDLAWFSSLVFQAPLCLRS